MWKSPMAGRTVPCYNGSSKKTLCKRGENNMSEATRYTIFFVLSIELRHLYCVGDDYP